jgi:hypothetical protein
MFGTSARSKWVDVAIHLKVPATWAALTATGNVDDKRVKRWKLSLETAINEIAS